MLECCVKTIEPKEHENGFRYDMAFDDWHVSSITMIGKLERDIVMTLCEDDRPLIEFSPYERSIFVDLRNYSPDGDIHPIYFINGYRTGTDRYRESQEATRESLEKLERPSLLCNKKVVLRVTYWHRLNNLMLETP